MPNGNAIFPPKDKFDVVRSITLADSINSIVKHANQKELYKEVFCSEGKSSIYGLCGITLSENNSCQLSKKTLSFVMLIISYIVKSPRISRIFDKFLVMGGLDKSLSESVELIKQDENMDKRV